MLCWCYKPLKVTQGWGLAHAVIRRLLKLRSGFVRLVVDRVALLQLFLRVLLLNLNRRHVVSKTAAEIRLFNIIHSALLFPVPSYLLHTRLLAFPSLPRPLYLVSIGRCIPVATWETACHRLGEIWVSRSPLHRAEPQESVTHFNPKFGDEALGYLHL